MRYDNIMELFAGIESAGLQKKIFAQIYGTKYSYKQLLEEIGKLHTLFQNNGFKKGDQIILSTDDDYYTSLFFLANLRYGIVTVFLDPEVPAKRAIAIIEKTDAKGFVMDEALFLQRDIGDNTELFYLKIKKNAQKKGLLFKRLLKNKQTGSTTDALTFPAILETITSSSPPLGFNRKI